MERDYFKEINEHLIAIKEITQEARDNGKKITCIASITDNDQKTHSMAAVGRTGELREEIIRIALNNGSMPVMKTIIKQVGVALQVYEVSERLGISPDNLSDFFNEQPKPKNEPPLPHPKCEA